MSTTTIDSLSDVQLRLVLFQLKTYGDLVNASLVCRRWYRISRECMRRHRRRFEDKCLRPLGDESAPATVLLPMKVTEIMIAGDAAPFPRRMASFCHCKHFMYLFGGNSIGNNACLNDFWKLDLTAFSWHRVLVSECVPSGRCRAMMCSIEDERKIILYGGYRVVRSVSGYLRNNVERMQDVHVFDIEQNKWSELPTSLGDVPPDSHDVCTVSLYIAKINSILVMNAQPLYDDLNNYGGPPGGPVSLWAYSLGSCQWIHITTIGAPVVSLTECQILSIEGGQRVVLLTRSIGNYTGFGGVHVLDLASTSWFQVDLTGVSLARGLATYYRLHESFGRDIFYVIKDNTLHIIHFRRYGCDGIALRSREFELHLNPALNLLWQVIDPCGISIILLAQLPDIDRTSPKRQEIVLNLSMVMD